MQKLWCSHNCWRPGSGEYKDLQNEKLHGCFGIVGSVALPSQKECFVGSVFSISPDVDNVKLSAKPVS